MNKNPCADCAGGPADCAGCPNNSENGVPAKLYTPKGAARAMLAGAVLKDAQGWTYWWDKKASTFYCKGKSHSADFLVNNFSGLFSDGA